MKISIILPVFNVADYIESCLRSIFAQSYKDIELLIVDDAAKDDSMQIVSSLLKLSPPEFPVTVIHHEQNKGLSAARNTGIAHCSGDYLLFVDSDDEITPNCIENLAKQAALTHADIVVGDYKVTGSEDYFPPLKLKTSLIRGNKRIRDNYMQEKIYVMAWNKLVRTSFLKRHGLYFKEGLLHEDLPWNFQCVFHAKSMAILKEVTYIYKVRPNSIKTNAKFHKEYQSACQIITWMAKYAASQGLQNDRCVFTYIEAEKLRLLYTCMGFGKTKEDLPELYPLLRSLPRMKDIGILTKELFHHRKQVRDLHYLLPPHEGEEYFWNIPNIMNKKTFREKARLYAWVAKRWWQKIRHPELG